MREAPTDIGVYVIRNIVSGRVYVGSAGSQCSGGGFKKRWRKHISDLSKGIHHSPALQLAWVKHGPEAFTFSVLELVAADGEKARTKALLLDCEQRHIDALQAVREGYNCSPTAGSRLGVVDRPEVKAACAERARARLAIGIPGFIVLGSKVTDEAKAKISAAHKGKKRSPAVGEAARKTDLERRAANTGIYAPDCSRKGALALVAGMAERKRLGAGEFSPEAKAKKSASLRAAWARRKQEAA